MHTVRALAAMAIAVSTLSVAATATAREDQGRALDARSAGRAVLVCDTDAATRRAFTREHGAAPVFITARQALEIRPTDPAWNAPRCMTAREHARYREAAANYARVP